MSCPVRTVWIVAREYAGIAEAGGVKNVSCSLAEGLVRSGREVTVFIPRYGCVTNPSDRLFSCTVHVSRKTQPVSFSVAVIRGVKIVFVESPLFSRKQDVYVYTADEARTVPGAVRGKGHIDVDTMNMLFQSSVLAYAERTGSVPDILHCQDAHTAILPALVRTDPVLKVTFRNTRLLVTIHNAGPGYRQNIIGLAHAAGLTGLPKSLLERALLNGRIEPFLLAADYAVLTTVSPWYAKELTCKESDRFTGGLSGEFLSRGIQVTGITNGIDYERYDPTDPARSLLPFSFDPLSGNLSGKYRLRGAFAERVSLAAAGGELTSYGSLEPAAHAVYYSYHGRIALQKGLDVLEKAAHVVLASQNEARFLVVGQGDPVLESLLVRASERYPGRFMYVRGYERSLARMAVALSDFIVLPSLFEPCGLEDYIGQIYGTLPVAHAVGGLQKVEEGRTGFLYASRPDGDDAQILAARLLEISAPVVLAPGEGCAAVPAYLEMIRQAACRVREAGNWDSIIENSYLPLYEKIPPAGA